MYQFTKFYNTFDLDGNYSSSGSASTTAEFNLYRSYSRQYQTVFPEVVQMTHTIPFSDVKELTQGSRVRVLSIDEISYWYDFEVTLVQDTEFEVDGVTEVQRSIFFSLYTSLNPNSPVAYPVAQGSVSGNPIGSLPTVDYVADYLLGSASNGEPLPVGSYQMEIPSQTFQVRSLEVRNLRVLDKRIDPESPDRTIQLRGNFFVSPNFSQHQVNPWTPSSNIDWRVKFKLGSSELAYDGFTTPYASDFDGKCGDFIYDLNLTELPDNYEGVLSIELNALINTEDGGNAIAQPDIVRATISRCKCETENAFGNNRLRERINIHSSPVNPSYPQSINNSSCQFLAGPGSFGYGWCCSPRSLAADSPRMIAA